MAEPNKENNTVVMPPNFILPICVESQNDGFFSVMKSIINRKSIDDNSFDSSLKLAMSGETFKIHSEDLTMNWAMLNSNKQQIRQFKLLGYWAIQNFSSFGNILFGKTWKAPERKNIQVVGPSGSEELQPEVIDEKIFGKLSLRIIEMDLSASTLAKFKHLVNVPSIVRKSKTDNTKGRTSKIKSFDIKDEYMEKGWIALRSGRNVFDVHFEENGSSRTFTQPEFLPHQNDMLTQPTDQEIEDHQEMDDHQINSVDELEPIVPCKRICRGVIKDNGRADHLDGDSRNDSLQTVLLEMQTNIGKITKWLDPEAAIIKSKEAYDQERLHLTIFKDKDTEIARLKASEQQVLQTNQNLTNDVSNLKEQIEKQTLIINSLQKGVDASSILNAKSESDLAASRSVIETMKLEISDKNGENAQLKTQVQELSENLAEARKQNVDMVASDATLQDLLHQWKDYAEKQTTELNLANEKVKHNNALQVELKEMKSYISGMTREMKSEIEKLEKDLIEAEKAKSQIFDQKQKCHAEVTVLKSEIDDLKKCLTNAAISNTQILDQKEKLRQELIVLKGMYVNSKATTGTQTDTCNETGGQSDKNRVNEFVPNDTVTIDAAAIVELSNEGSHSEPMVREIIPNDQQELHPESEVVFPDDPSMQELRNVLRKLKFGWMKFATKNCENYFPAFVRPPDADGISRAQWVTANRTVSTKKYEFYDFYDSLPHHLKENSEINALKRFNEKFRFSYS